MAQTGTNWAMETLNNMVATLSALLKTDANGGARCKSTCARCLLRYTEGLFGGQVGYCRFSQDRLLLSTHKMEGKEYNCCYYCLTKNEKCFKVCSDSLWLNLGHADSDSFQPTSTVT
jgi:hypothetical protein